MKISEADDQVDDQVVAVVGPTAAGKSDLAVALARRMQPAVGRQGEIVNADSAQLYRGMDIGTAKLPPAERRSVPHHLIDVLDVADSASVAVFQAHAREAIVDCHRRGATPVLVGGSALYVRAVLDRFEFPGTDPDLRAELEGELARIGPESLHARLAEADTRAAEEILPSNGRRIVRALEVIALTGRPFGASLPERSVRAYAYSRVTQIGLDVPRDVLDRRIERRVDTMWEAGFVDEVRGLEAAGLREGRTASRALGYRQILAYLAGDTTEQEAKAATVRATRKFARRQDAWFRKDPRIAWLPYDDPRAVDHSSSLIADSTL